MDALATSASDRRRITRAPWQGRVEIEVSVRGEERASALADSINFSEGGMRLRLQDALEIHASVRLRLFLESLKRPLLCAARVAWVTQRLDLRDTPPFLYDVGVEFVNPPSRLRQLALRTGVVIKIPETARAKKSTILAPVIVRERCYVPRLKHEVISGRWHLVVMADGTPCFSQRYPTERKAIEAWERLKRHV